MEKEIESVEGAWGKHWKWMRRIEGWRHGKGQAKTDEQRFASKNQGEKKRSTECQLSLEFKL